MAFITVSAARALGLSSFFAPTQQLTHLSRSFALTTIRPHRISPVYPAITHTITKMTDASADATNVASKVPVGKDPKSMTDEEWRAVLTAEEYQMLRNKGTEYPGTGEYDGFYPKEGHFVCRACSNPLYSAASKFKSGCGWPAFDKCYKNSIAVEVDMSFGMRRVEIMCAKCDGHLGHVFEGERMTTSNERHCVNSMSVKFVDGVVDLEEGKLM